MKNNTSSDLAERIAAILEAETQSSDVAALFAGLEKLNHRLDKLEAERGSLNVPAPPAPRLAHPSQDRFAIAEAIVDSVFDRESKEKACTFEPNGRPCDHCSMCNSRGF
jgi:hypothetical protein